MSYINSSAQRDIRCNDGYIIDYFQSRGRHFKRYNVIAITLGYILSLSHNALTLCTNVIASISYRSRLSEALSVLAVIDLSLQISVIVSSISYCFAIIMYLLFTLSHYFLYRSRRRFQILSQTILQIEPHTRSKQDFHKDLFEVLKIRFSTAAKSLGSVLQLSRRVFSAQDGRRKKLKICPELP